jgi:hypothetical protein
MVSEDPSIVKTMSFTKVLFTSRFSKKLRKSKLAGSSPDASMLDVLNSIY